MNSIKTTHCNCYIENWSWIIYHNAINQKIVKIQRYKSCYVWYQKKDLCVIFAYSSKHWSFAIVGDVIQNFVKKVETSNCLNKTNFMVPKKWNEFALCLTTISEIRERNLLKYLIYKKCSYKNLQHIKVSPSHKLLPWMFMLKCKYKS